VAMQVVLCAKHPRGAGFAHGQSWPVKWCVPCFLGHNMIATLAHRLSRGEVGTRVEVQSAER
jgi:hypothetical protein